MTNRRAAAAAVISALFAALLAWLAFPPAGLGPLAWVALVPLLLALRGASPMRAALLGWLWGAAFFALLCGWLSVFSPAAPAAIAAGTGLVYAGAAVLYARRPGPLTAAAAWTAAEWLRNLGPLGFTWGDLGYALWDAPVFLQAADLGGVFLLSAAIAWTNGAVAEAFAAPRPRAIACAAAAPLALVALILYGAPVLALGGAGVPFGDVVLLQPCLLKGADWAADPVRAKEVLWAATRRATTGRRPSLVVWPETVVRRYLDREPALRAEIGALAREIGAPILVGAPGTDGADRKFNAVFLVDSSGAVAGRYDKAHLVPIGEYVPLGGLLGGAVERLSPEAPGDFTAAAAPALVTLPTEGGLRLGPLVCFEAAFGRLARRHVRAGAEVLVAVTNDGWSFSRAAHLQHFAMNVLRAVETRRWLLRCANTGVSAAVDPRGVVHDAVPPYVAGAARGRLDASAAGPTPYVRWGDWPGPLAVAILMTPWVGSFFSRRSSSTSPSSPSSTSAS